MSAEAYTRPPRLPRSLRAETYTTVRLPERDLAECILHLAALVLEPLGPEPPIDDARHAIGRAIELWNAHVAASKYWPRAKPKALRELRKAARDEHAPPGAAKAFARLSERWRQEFAADPRLVGAWSFEVVEGGRPRLVCEMALPEGVRAEVPPPAERRIAIGGCFLDEVRIHQGSCTYVLFPVEHHRGVVGSDGVATVYAKMPSALQLFAEGRLPRVGGPPVEVAIAGKSLGPMVLTELRCAGEMGHHDIAVLVFHPHPRSA